MSLAMVGTTSATVQADEAHARHGAHCPTRNRAPSETKAPPQLQDYYHGDWRLGPSYLTRTGPIGRMLRGYYPQDDTSRYWFLGCYWQTSQQTNLSGWWFPDNQGFVLRNGRPVERPTTLRKGQLVDLFGSGRGNFLAPAGTPYVNRALPPTNLDRFSATDPAFNYHLYRVVTPFTVQAGPIRPWFGQRGLGLQYVTSTTIPNLITSQNLEEIIPSSRPSDSPRLQRPLQGRPVK
jgi:Tuberculosis necrotizing toxin